MLEADSDAPGASGKKKRSKERFSVWACCLSGAAL